MKIVPAGEWYCPDCLPRPLILTSWTPLAEVDVKHGGLCMLVGSHTYGQLENRMQWSQCPKTLKTMGRNRVWVTTNYSPGDVVIFDVRTVRCRMLCCS